MNRAGPVIILLCLTGCAIGPDYKRPPLAVTDGYPVPDMAAGGQNLVTGAPPSQWWQGFGSPSLDALVEQAQCQSPTILAAAARLKAAREDLRAEKGALWPSLSAGQDQTQQSYSNVPGGSGTFYDVTTQSVSISYGFDLMGGERRTIEGKAARSDYALYEQAAASQSLSANVVATAIDVSALAEQAEASRDIIASQQALVALVQGQVQAGSASQEDVLSAEARLSTQDAELNALCRDLAQARHRLAVLLGRSPAEAVAVDWKLADLTLPGNLPVSLPSDLVEQRPDILAQEARLQQASADVGVAEANMFPRLTLDGNYSASVWYLTNRLWQPIFAGGSLNAQRKSAVDAYEAAGADYRATVLGAFQNVADVLSALENDNKTWASSSSRLNDGQASLALMEDRFSAGTVSRIGLLTQRQAFQETRIAFLQATADRLADTVALYQALGGHDW